MCSPSTENKQAASLSGAVPDRLNNTLEQCYHLANSSTLPQLSQYLPQVPPLFVAVFPTPGTSCSGGWWDDGNIIQKILGKYVSLAKKQGDVQWVTRQSTITFEPRGNTWSPAYVRVGHAMGNLFLLHLGRKWRFKVPKTKMFVKLVRFCKLWPSLVCGLLTVKYSR